jgi:ANTAR domain
MSPDRAASADRAGRPAGPGNAPDGPQEELVVRRTPDGWRVDGTGGPAADDRGGPGGDVLPDLVSAMVLAELLAGDVPPPRKPAIAETAGPPDGTAPAGAGSARLEATIAQLEHALATRVQIERAIGILAERHRVAPRQAFDLLRKVARTSGNRVHDLADEVVASATNPLLLLPAELARPPLAPPARGSSRRGRG